MEDLSFESILGEQEIDNLFSDPEESSVEETIEEPEQEENPDEGKKENDETKKTTEVSPESLFEEEQPESVGSEKKEDKGKGGAATDEGKDTSPNNFYSSIANALAVDGIFPNLDDETIKKAKDAESFSDLIEAEINARLDERQQRISKALEDGVEPSDIKKYEGALQYLNGISDAQLLEEGERGEELRRRIIYQDYLNKAFSPEKAQKMTERSIDSGTDLEDAKEALQSNKEYFQNTYNKLLRDAEAEAQEAKAERQKQSDSLKKSIMEDKQLLGGMELSNDVRRKVFDNLSRPIYKDPETGEYLTALQKYQAENPADFLKYVSLFMTLTDGFKDFKSFTKAEVKKEMKKGLRELEQTLNNTRRTSDGSLNPVAGGKKDDAESYFSGLTFDL